MDTQTHDIYQRTRQIADQLGETTPTPLGPIRRILQTIGPERTQAFVKQALEVEANGGMLLPDSSRKRTLGGVFFRLARDQVSEAERRAIWPSPPWQQRTQREKARAVPTPTQLPPFQWEQADEVIATVTSHPGKATTVNVTIIGRPGEIVERQGVIILALQSAAAPPCLRVCRRRPRSRRTISLRQSEAVEARSRGAPEPGGQADHRGLSGPSPALRRHHGLCDAGDNQAAPGGQAAAADSSTLKPPRVNCRLAAPIISMPPQNKRTRRCGAAPALLIDCNSGVSRC